MTDIGKAIDALKAIGIEAFEGAGILIIPASSPEEIFDLANRCRRLFKEIDYQKSWQIDPYYLERRNAISGKMFLNNLDDSQKLHAL